MPLFWNADVESARWVGADLMFKARTDKGTLVYVVPADRLTDARQRTSSEVLSINLPTLRPVLEHLARGQRDGTTIAVQ